MDTNLLVTIGEVEKDPWGLAFKIVTKRFVSRSKTPGLSSTEVGFSLILASELILLFSMPRAAKNRPLSG